MDNDNPQNLLSRLYRSYISLLALAFVLVGIITGFVAFSMQGGEVFFQSALTELSIASFIAAVLLFVSDRFLKDRLFTDIKMNISTALKSFQDTAFDLHYYSRLPDDLRERVSDTVLAAPVIQRDVTYRYDLSETDIDGKLAYRAKISACSVYDNISSTRQRFAVRESLPPFNFEEVRNDYAFTRINSSIEGSGDFPSTLEPHGIRSDTSVRDDGSKVFARSASLDSDSTLQVKFEGVAYIRSDEWIAFEASLPTINMLCLTSGSGLEIRGQPGETQKDIWLAKANHWELKGAVLPGQGFDIWIE